MPRIQSRHFVRSRHNVNVHVFRQRGTRTVWERNIFSKGLPKPLWTQCTHLFNMFITTLDLSFHLVRSTDWLIPKSESWPGRKVFTWVMIVKTITETEKYFHCHSTKVTLKTGCGNWLVTLYAKNRQLMQLPNFFQTWMEFNNGQLLYFILTAFGHAIIYANI